MLPKDDSPFLSRASVSGQMNQFFGDPAFFPGQSRKSRL